MVTLNKNGAPWTNGSLSFIFFITFFFSLNLSCRKFVEIDPPRTDLVKSTVFSSDATAKAAMVDIYSQMTFTGFASGDVVSISFVASLSSDEMINVNAGLPELQQFYENAVVASNSIIDSWWSNMYLIIYKANAIIEGLNMSSGVSENLKKQLIGEAKFMRAFSHFYLVNLFGDVPLILSTDYQTNKGIARTPKSEVFTQIITDLKDAEILLSTDYSFSQGQRVRPNKWAAIALLARTYLYKEDWAQAETESTKIINNTSSYGLVSDLTRIFHKTSTEVIWQLEPRFSYPNDFAYFYIFSTPPSYAILSTNFLNSFEAGDQRKLNWIGNISDGSDTYYFPAKYQSFVALTEFSTIFRLAEQYLIRAEARAKQNKLTGSSGAGTDINVIRSRAGLVPTPAATQSQLLSAIEQERKIELFTEWGHRWLDLKRTGRINAVLGPVKGSNWQQTDALFPIPESQVRNSAVTQNPGY